MLTLYLITPKGYGSFPHQFLLKHAKHCLLRLGSLAKCCLPGGYGSSALSITRRASVHNSISPVPSTSRQLNFLWSLWWRSTYLSGLSPKAVLSTLPASPFLLCSVFWSVRWQETGTFCCTCLSLWLSPSSGSESLQSREQVSFAFVPYRLQLWWNE